ncbi:protein lap1 isoform X2 [Sitodiplosis mosellana]|uniref:protein lap1 isoform X2 n=1 Tax=Sitodiplosis mosellana TaxID=263140 RepID=UPI002444849D|nr:protein lap1 isoform X2 [Sitodiplosis mosellana]
MPWWTCFNCASKTTQTNCNDVFVLDYAHHSLHDVPADVFQYERTLEELYLSSNRITELPRQLFLCHGLKVLDLSDNDLSSIPTALSSLTNMRKINLARNSLIRLTDSIIACKSLTFLDLSINSLEKLPDAITSLFGLEELYLNDTFLEYLPANFGRLTNLRILELRDNNLITLPKSMNRLQCLKRLDIGNNEFTELPEVIGSLTALNELWVDGNRIRRFNCNVSNLKELVHFDASNNLIQYLPTEIGSWQRCQELCLSANEIEELPFSIGMMKSLIALKMDENQLQELPDSICEMESLEELMVSHNDLFKLPSTIGLMRRLRFLTADENLIRSLPNEICSCSSLTILSVRGNKLTKIPVDIGRLTQLRVLNIVNNFLSNLPVTILNLTQLSALWISDNQSQPLMPLQKEFHKESQCFYLTCYLLPQVYTTNATPTPNAPPSTSTAPDSNYDYYAPSTCDTNSQTNMHIAALENLSLAAIAQQKRKRNICFASDPPQEIAPNLRLMRSPTPYPKELRMMQAKFAANKMQHQQIHMQRHAQQQENGTNNLDKHSNTKPLNTMNTENIMNMQAQQQQPPPPQQQQQQATSSNDFDAANHLHGMPPMMNNIGNDMTIGNMSVPNINMNNVPNANINMNLSNANVNISVPNMNLANMSIQSRQHLPPLNQPHQPLEYNNVSRQFPSNPNAYGDMYRSDSRMQTPIMHSTGINNDLVQYDSMNAVRRNASGFPESDTVDYNDEENGLPNNDINQQQHQSYHTTHPYDTNSIDDDSDLKTNHHLQSYPVVPMDTETNHNNIHLDTPQKLRKLNQISSNNCWSKFNSSNNRHRIT